ncbi:MAG: hypothetical protein NTY19_51510 [Planctomycetota bacterium]|nr:hypothetical protein [Planctomycetota bacterium]
MRRFLFTLLVLGVSPLFLAWGARAAEDRPDGPRKEAAGRRENPERREAETRREAQARSAGEAPREGARREREQAERRAPEVTRPGREPAPPEQRELQGRLERIKKEIAEHQAAGRHEPAEALKREAEKLMQGARNGQAQRQLQELKERIHQLRENGRGDEAARLEAQARKMAERLQGEQGRQERQGPGPGPEDAQRRMQHLRQAIDNLHAAGVHDQAEQVARQAQQLEREAQSRHPGPEQAPQVMELHQKLRNLNDRVGKLEAALQELLKKMK